MNVGEERDGDAKQATSGDELEEGMKQATSDDGTDVEAFEELEGQALGPCPFAPPPFTQQ